MLRWGMVLISGCALRAAPVNDLVGRLDSSIAEPSGLVASVAHPGVLWTHGDSGTGNVLFAVDAEGKVLRRVDLAGPELRDWEELTKDDAGNLWIADLGNNGNDRRDLALYRLPEPDPNGEGREAPNLRVGVRYPDQAAFPDPTALNFDAEAVFWWRDRMYVLTKHRSDHATTLYRLPSLEPEVVLERVGSFELGGPNDRTGGKATAASLSGDGAWLALLTYHEIYLFSAPSSGDDWLAVAPRRIPLEPAATRQCESIAWLGTSLILGNEDGDLFRVDEPLTRIRPVGAAAP